MEPITPASFPRRQKRFQSYSMTPMDQFQQQVQSSKASNLFSSSKFTNSRLNRKSTLAYQQYNPNSDTNQFSINKNRNISDHDSIVFQNSQKSYNQQIQKQIHGINSYSNTLQSKNTKKLANSEIFGFSSIQSKQRLGSNKIMKSSLFLQNHDDIKNSRPSNFKFGSTKHDKKEGQMRVPSFLLNKKKTTQTDIISPFSPLQNENISMTENLRFQIQKKRSFKKQKQFNQTKFSETENDSQNGFSPPSHSKISFLKETASTLATNLQRQESRRTFKDFQDLQQLKQFQKSMEESDNSNNLQNQFNKLFIKDDRPHKQDPINIQNEIAELFSDQESVQEQFNEDLKQQLQQLF